MDLALVYRGTFRLSDAHNECLNEVAEALLSPTRTYLPLIKRVGVKNLHGLIHYTGGGQTKIGNFGKPENRYVKKIVGAPFFNWLKTQTKMSWEEMYRVFNMGHRLEAVLPERYAKHCLAVAEQCGIESRIIGHVEKGGRPGKKVIIQTKHGTFKY